MYHQKVVSFGLNSAEDGNFPIKRDKRKIKIFVAYLKSIVYESARNSKTIFFNIVNMEN